MTKPKKVQPLILPKENPPKRAFGLTVLNQLFNTLATEFITLAIRPISRNCSTV